MRAQGLGALCGFALVLAALGLGRAELPLATRAEQGPAAPTLIAQYKGAPTCAATACHGATKSAGRPRANLRVLLNEYTTWIANDKHADAFNVLGGERSRAIMAHFPDQPEAHRNERCLVCHSTPTATPTAGLAERFSRDGIGCESCHGPAQRWYGPHTRNDWAGQTAAAKESFGMAPTTDLARRAETCVGCHVGAPAQGGLAVRDVDHDLIAAGHPRLNFEFSAYFANMPPHWNVEASPDRSADFPARSWAVGRVVAAKAELELLRDRIQRPGAAMRWPEFSEYDCFACHHDLRDDPWRKPAGAAAKTAGRPQWGSWHDHLLAPILNDADGRSLAAQFGEIRRLMGEPRPQPSKVGELAGAAAQTLEHWVTERSTSHYDAGRLGKLLSSIELLSQPSELKSWDDAAQSYLALVPLSQASQKLAPKTDGAGRRGDLQRLRDYLRFPAGYDSPRVIDPTKSPTVR